jgi:transcriptional antiterminator NusG
VSDELHKLAEDADQAVPDDAVSNRSDDTMLEEDLRHEVAGADSSQDEPKAADEVAANESATEQEAAVEQAEAAEAEQAEVDGGATEPAPQEASTDEEISSEEISTEEVSEDDANDEEQGSGRGAIEEDLSEEEIQMDWYILKVQSNRERSIAEALERKMKIEGLDQYFDQVIVPTEKVTEFKGGKKKVVERKLYPGYIVVHMHINDDTWFAVRETSGVGDFTGAGGKPTPMLASEVARIVQTEVEETSEAPKLDIKFSTGDKVKVKEGNFENFEGEVGSIDEASGRVTVMINIFGRSTPVELEYWQIEAV